MTPLPNFPNHHKIVHIIQVVMSMLVDAVKGHSVLTLSKTEASNIGSFSSLAATKKFRTFSKY